MTTKILKNIRTTAAEQINTKSKIADEKCEEVIERNTKKEEYINGTKFLEEQSASANIQEKVQRCQAQSP
jgi:hypothetical protein